MARLPIFRRNTKKALTGMVYISPWVMGLLLFTLAPLVYSFYISFCKFSILGDTTFVGLKNYEFLLKYEPLLWTGFRQSLLWTVCGTVFSTSVAVFFAVLIFKGLRGTGTVRTIFYFPVVLNAVALTTVIKYLTRHEGWVNGFLGLFGVNPVDFWGIPVNIFLTILGTQIFFVGSSVVIFMAALSNVSLELYESAVIDGAGPLRKFYFITLPMISPLIYYSAITGVIFSFSSYHIPLLYFGNQEATQQVLAGTGDVMYHIGLLSFNYAFHFFKLGIASAIGWLMLLFSLIFVSLIYIFGRRLVFYEAED